MSTTIRRVTREDVAKRAGVTPTIVSYVVNENRYVDAQKRARVLAAIEELGYRPNALARALKGKRSNHILFVVDNLLSSHFARIIKQMDRWAYGKGCFVSLCESQNSEEFVSQIYRRYFDAVIIASGSFRQRYIQQLIDTGIPVVVLEMRDYGKLHGRFALVDTGLYQGARLCVRSLVERGRRNLVYVHSKAEEQNECVLEEDFRYRGFVDEVREAGLSSYRVIHGYRNREELARMLRDLVSEGFRIDGIFGRTDGVAIPAMQELVGAGYRLPDDCSVIGVDNSELCDLVTPRLASLDIDRSEVGRIVTRLLDRMLSGEKTEDETLHPRLQAHLVGRESL